MNKTKNLISYYNSSYDVSIIIVQWGSWDPFHLLKFELVCFQFMMILAMASMLLWIFLFSLSATNEVASSDLCNLPNEAALCQDQCLEEYVNCIEACLGLCPK